MARPAPTTAQQAWVALLALHDVIVPVDMEVDRDLSWAQLSSRVSTSRSLAPGATRPERGHHRRPLAWNLTTPLTVSAVIIGSGPPR